MGFGVLHYVRIHHQPKERKKERKQKAVQIRIEDENRKRK
jgi:hypothetical protein